MLGVCGNSYKMWARIACPFLLACKPQHIECERGMGLAGQTDIHIDSESILITLQCPKNFMN